MWNLICNFINAVTLQHSYHWCDFISLHWCSRLWMWNGHTVERQSAQKCWHNRTMGLFALIDGSHQLEGREEERVVCFTSGFMTVCLGPARCRSGPTLQWQCLSLMAWECVCPLPEGKSILVLSLPVCFLPGEQKHKIHWQALLIQPQLQKPTLDFNVGRPGLFKSHLCWKIKSERCI